MRILAIEHELPNVTADQFQRLAADEARKVWELIQSDVVRESYFRADRNEAVLLLECSSVTEAQEILSLFPFVQNKLIDFELIPLIAYPGLERLFAKE